MHMQPSFLPPSRLPPLRFPSANPSRPPPRPRPPLSPPQGRRTAALPERPTSNARGEPRAPPPFGRQGGGRGGGSQRGSGGNKRTRQRAELRRRKGERERMEDEARHTLPARPASPPRDRSPFPFFPLLPLGPPPHLTRSPSPLSPPPRPQARASSPPGPPRETMWQRGRRKRRREEEEREAERVWERVLEEDWESRRKKRRRRRDRDVEVERLDVVAVEGGEEGEVREVGLQEEETTRKHSSTATSTAAVAPSRPRLSTSILYKSSYLSRFSTSPVLPRSERPRGRSSSPSLPSPPPTKRFKRSSPSLSPPPAPPSLPSPRSHHSPPCISVICDAVPLDEPVDSTSDALPAFLQPGFLRRPPTPPLLPYSAFYPLPSLSDNKAVQGSFRFHSGLVGPSVVVFSPLPTPPPTRSSSPAPPTRERQEAAPIPTFEDTDGRKVAGEKAVRKREERREEEVRTRREGRGW